MNRVPLVPKAQVDAREKQLRSIAEAEAKLAAVDKGPGSKESDRKRGELIAERDRLKRATAEGATPRDGCAGRGTPGGLFPKVQDVPVHIRGSYARLGPVVGRRLPRFFAGDAQPPIRSGSGRRELRAGSRRRRTR